MELDCCCLTSEGGPASEASDEVDLEEVRDRAPREVRSNGFVEEEDDDGPVRRVEGRELGLARLLLALLSLLLLMLLFRTGPLLPSRFPLLSPASINESETDPSEPILSFPFEIPSTLGPGPPVDDPVVTVALRTCILARLSARPAIALRVSLESPL